MKRGFKTNSEKTSAILRKKNGLNEHDPLSARALASHLDVAIVEPSQLPGFSSTTFYQHLLGAGRKSWSALCLQHSEQSLIIHNSTHSIKRQESNLMHELSHILLKHRPTQFVELPGLGIPLRDFDKDQEDEANWLAGCLQLPRTALVWALKQKMSGKEISDHFTASQDLVRMRINVTGVSQQYRGGSYRTREK